MVLGRLLDRGHGIAQFAGSVHQMHVKRCAPGYRFDHERAIVTFKDLLEAEIRLGLERTASKVTQHEWRVQDAQGLELALEDMLVVQHASGQGIVTHVGNATHLEHGGRVCHGVVALDTTGVEPRHVNAGLDQTLAQTHILRHQAYMAEAEALERPGYVLRYGLITLPRARIVGLVNDGPVRGLVAAIDHGDPHSLHQLGHLAFENIDPARPARSFVEVREAHSRVDIIWL